MQVHDPSRPGSTPAGHGSTVEDGPRGLGGPRRRVPAQDRSGGVALSRSAVATVVAGAVGAVLAVAQLLVPAAVPIERFSYPFDAGPSAVVQVLLFLHHVIVAAGVLAVVRSGAAGDGLLGRIGGRVAAAALVLLGVQEVVAIAAAAEVGATPLVDGIETVYGVLSVLLGLGFVLLGVAVLHAGRWRGWHRWVPLVIGIYVFVPMTPAVLGPYLVGRLALGLWSVLFIALGAALLQERTAAEPPRVG